jgi:hypothetical protein
MTVVAWVLFVSFGLFALNGFLKFFSGSSLNWFHGVMWFLSIFITAFSAGVIWGGLLN